ncbi:hypothetical protein MJO28_008137 [Puccinia striiformis f. sp. tritici]|uniref:Uncharacterized protein n=1 Tax=Puccinia striiformis f. sp. tritici TaxID=168172 RepID=A0ACC0EBA8_9BASI|nr:hypothetical protein MJO28_008137 [Puccinia striiformis f. sp. tritici]
MAAKTQEEEELSRLTLNLPFSTSKNSKEPPKPKLKLNLQNNNNLRLNMMEQLLCSQALLESESCKLISFDRFTNSKQTINRLENQLHSINSKLNLELKILKATSIIGTDQDHLNQFPTKFKSLNQQKESIQTQLNTLKTKSFQHLIAVLALAFKSLEQQQQQSTLDSHTTFDGPHLFANNNTTPSSSSPNDHSLEPQIDALQLELDTQHALVAEQASDISLLELELDTLKHSTSNHSSSQDQIHVLQSKNDLLNQELSASQEQIKASFTELAKLQKQLETRNVASVRSEDNKSKELESRLKSKDLEITSLSSDLKSIQSTLTIETQKSEERIKESERRLSDLESKNQSEWDSFHSKLMNTVQKDSSLSNLIDSPISNDQFITGLDQFIEANQTVVSNLNQELVALNTQLSDSKIGHDQEKSQLNQKILELENQILELKTAPKEEIDDHKPQDSSEEFLKLKNEVLSKDREIQDLQSIHHQFEKSLREIWKHLPVNLEARSGATNESELSVYKPGYNNNNNENQPQTTPKKAVFSASTGGLGGLFGLGKRTPTPTPIPDENPTDEQEFSVEKSLSKIKILVDNDHKLVDRLIAIDTQKEYHKSNSLRAQKLVNESQDALRIYQAQVKELEERLEYADTQSAAMLEKVNDLMESEEKSNMGSRRAEQTLQRYTNEITDLKLQLQHHQSSPSISSDSTTLLTENANLKDQVEDLSVQLQDLHAQEIANRKAFLDDLARLNVDNSELKIRIRQLERSLKNQ